MLKHIFGYFGGSILIFDGKFDGETSMFSRGKGFPSPGRYPSYPLDRWSFPGIGWGSPEGSVLWVYPI